MVLHQCLLHQIIVESFVLLQQCFYFSLITSFCFRRRRLRDSLKIMVWDRKMRKDTISRHTLAVLTWRLVSVLNLVWSRCSLFSSILLCLYVVSTLLKYRSLLLLVLFVLHCFETSPCFILWKFLSLCRLIVVLKQVWKERIVYLNIFKGWNLLRDLFYSNHLCQDEYYVRADQKTA